MKKHRKDNAQFQKILMLNLALSIVLFLVLAVSAIFASLLDAPRIILYHILGALGLSLILIPLGWLKDRHWWVLYRAHTKRADPILLLTGYGLDLYEFSETIMNATKHVDEQIENANQKISILDTKIQETHQDMERIFQIVTHLANQEVNLISAVGKTSEEIRFMFDIVNAVIYEIDSRNENMMNLVQMSQNGGEKVKKTNALIKSISEKADDMLRMVDFINKVTKETNLLAINAAIEASHSDNEGKGFAVIADEMKKLAVLTGQKAKEITKLMRGNVDDYQYAHKASQESGEAFHFISSEIHIVSGTIAEVVQTISELKSRGSAVIAQAEDLDRTAEAVKSSSGEVYGEIVNVNENLTDLESLSNQVRQDLSRILTLQKSIAEKSKKVYEISMCINGQTDSYLGVETHRLKP